MERKSKNNAKKGTLERVIGWTLPFLNKYDALGEAEKLIAEDTSVQETQLSREEVAYYLEQSHSGYNKALRYSAILADTLDRTGFVTGQIFAEASGSVLGGFPGIAANISEESLEMIPKIPALTLLLAKNSNRSEAYRLMKLELVSAAVPVAGDIFVDLGNRYLKAADKAIRKEAKEKILNQRQPIKELERKSHDLSLRSLLLDAQ
ncbi:MAG: hypothetical protein Q8P81_00785 [Nanoarchaeota archaeon]|nr:hypothetical protein [Nanoarchaeota archaeon]